MINKYFKFYASCIPIKGFKRGVICDFRRGSIFYIPNSILEILEEYSTKVITELFNDYESQSVILKKYFDFLIENELIFYTDDLDNFPEINKRFIKPFEINIVLLEIDNFDSTKLNLFETQQISQIGCSELVLISHKNSIISLEKIMLMLDKSKIKTVTYFVDYKHFFEQKYTELSNAYLRLREIIVYNCPIDITMPNIKNVSFTNDSVETILTKKISNTDDFLLNINGFLESQEYNLFYNRRVFIDNDNNIKHSIEENEKYGMIKNQNLIEIISNNEFKKLWGISKNQIEVCKDCEYRYICPDNRIPIVKGKDLYYHLTDCNYNPYTNLWQ